MMLLTLMSFCAIIVSTSMWAFGRLSQEDKLLYVEGLDESMLS